METKTVHVEVKPIDIQRGEKGSVRYCPIARAYRRAARVRNSIVVTSRSIRHNTTMYDFFGDLPIEAQDFIDAFDNGRPVEPISFDVTIRKEPAIDW